LRTSVRARVMFARMVGSPKAWVMLMNQAAVLLMEAIPG
jgi:hypothetical protein